MFEPFKNEQVGSSTMPHKRNPHKSERICSLARVIKSNVITALDNIVLEDERDITNSGAERVIFCENFVLLDYIINQLTENFRTIEFNLSKKGFHIQGCKVYGEKTIKEFIKRLKEDIRYAKERDSGNSKEFERLRDNYIKAKLKRIDELAGDKLKWNQVNI